jgi:hypothetical protein
MLYQYSFFSGHFLGYPDSMASWQKVGIQATVRRNIRWDLLGEFYFDALAEYSFKNIPFHPSSMSVNRYTSLGSATARLMWKYVLQFGAYIFSKLAQHVHDFAFLCVLHFHLLQTRLSYWQNWSNYAALHRKKISLDFFKYTQYRIVSFMSNFLIVTNSIFCNL